MLADDDWLAVEFYQRVREQYINQTPMGAGKGAPLHLSPRLEGYRAALELYDYPRWLWPWLIRWATMLHGLVNGMDEVSNVEWHAEFGKHRRKVRPEEF